MKYHQLVRFLIFGAFIAFHNAIPCSSLSTPFPITIFDLESFMELLRHYNSPFSQISTPIKDDNENTMDPAEIPEPLQMVKID